MKKINLKVTWAEYVERRRRTGETEREAQTRVLQEIAPDLTRDHPAVKVLTKALDFEDAPWEALSDAIRYLTPSDLRRIPAAVELIEKIRRVTRLVDEMEASALGAYQDPSAGSWTIVQADTDRAMARRIRTALDGEARA